MFSSSSVSASPQAADEEDNVINGVRSRVKAAGIEETRDNCWNFFIQTVRAHEIALENVVIENIMR